MIHNYTRVQVILLVLCQSVQCCILNMEPLDHHSQLEVQMRYTVYNNYYIYNIIIIIIIAEKKTKMFPVPFILLLQLLILLSL